MGKTEKEKNTRPKTTFTAKRHKKLVRNLKCTGSLFSGNGRKIEMADRARHTPSIWHQKSKKCVVKIETNFVIILTLN